MGLNLGLFRFLNDKTHHSEQVLTMCHYSHNPLHLAQDTFIHHRASIRGQCGNFINGPYQKNVSTTNVVHCLQSMLLLL